MTEERNKQNLNQAQRASHQKSDKARQAVNTAKNLTPMGALSLASQIQITDFLFILPFMAALLKDILDVVAEFVPLAGLIFIFCISICCSIFIGLFMLLLGGGGGKRKAAKVILRYLILIFGTAIEAFIPGVNLLPIETLLIVIIYVLVLVERKGSVSQESYA